MAEEATVSSTRLSTLLHQGRASYLTLLGASIIQVIIYGILGAIWAGILIGVVLSTSSVGAGTIVAGILVSLLVLFIPVYLLQFYDVAIVVSDTGVLGAFTQSAGFVRRNIVSTLGYTIIAQLIGLISVIPVLWAFLGMPLNPNNVQATTTQFAQASTGEFLVPLLAVSVVLGTIVSSILITCRTILYTNLVEGDRTTQTESAA